MHRFWHTFTSLGDSGFLLPAALLVGLWLFLRPHTRTAACQWALMFGACGFVVMVSKIAFMGWGIGSARFNFTGFSGHTALATSVWPVLLWVAASRASRRWRLAAAVLGWCLAIGIGVSRLALEAHSLSEVVAGAMLGTVVSAGFLWLQGPAPAPTPGRRWPLVAAVVLMALASQGRPAPTQDALALIAAKLANRERPYTRAELLSLRAVGSSSRRTDAAL
jgi:membrane-associated phospholipid phosphatase